MDKNERWQKISDTVEGKSKKECGARYTWIRQSLLSKKGK
jgi:hypothetical protein